MWSIGVYQIYISPRKGFRCPHHQLHGVDSCSTYIRNLFSTQELAMSSVLAQTIRIGVSMAMAKVGLRLG